MDYCILGRFQGALLGSIIGEALADRANLSERTKIIQYQPQDWLSARSKITDILIQAHRLEVGFLGDRLNDQLKSVDLGDLLSQGNLVGEALAKETAWAVTNRILLILLPLIVFHLDNLDVVRQTVAQYNSKQPNITEIKEDISIWSYFLSLALSNRFAIDRTNVSSIVKQVLTGVEVTKTSLVKKLEIVAQAWEHGHSLNNLAEELSNMENLSQTAIALCFYCFASTPKDFRLSVKRAANLNNNMALPTTALTGAVSGAYNGLAGIPRKWDRFGNQNQAYQQAKKTAQQLFTTWLGICVPENNQFFDDSSVNAVALPNMIQPRTSLNIISQESS